MPPRGAVRDASASPPSPRLVSGGSLGVLQVDASSLHLLVQQTAWITGQMHALITQQQQQQAISAAVAAQQQHQQLQQQQATAAAAPMQPALQPTAPAASATSPTAPSASDLSLPHSGLVAEAASGVSLPPRGLFSEAHALESALSNSGAGFRVLSAFAPRLYPFLPQSRLLRAASQETSGRASLFGLVALGLGAYLVWISVDDTRVKRVLAATAMLLTAVQFARLWLAAALSRFLLRSLLTPLSGDGGDVTEEDETTARLESGSHRRLLNPSSSSSPHAAAANFHAKAALSFHAVWDSAFGLWPAECDGISGDRRVSVWWPWLSAASSLVHLLLLLSPLLFLPFLQDAAPDALWFPPSPANYASASESDRRWLFFCESDPADVAGAVDRDLYPVWYTLSLLAALLAAMCLDCALARAVLSMTQVQMALRDKMVERTTTGIQTDAMVHRTLSEAYQMRVAYCSSGSSGSSSQSGVRRWNLLGCLYLLVTVVGGLFLYSLIVGVWVLFPVGLCVVRFVCEGGLSCRACRRTLSPAERKARANAAAARKDDVTRRAAESRLRKEEAALKREADRLQKQQADRIKREQREQNAAAEKQRKMEAKQHKSSASTTAVVPVASSAAVSSGPVSAIQPALSPVTVDSFAGSAGGDGLSPSHAAAGFSAARFSAESSLVEPIAIPPEPLFGSLGTPAAAGTAVIPDASSVAASASISPVVPPSPVLATITASPSSAKKQPAPVYRQGTKPLP